MPYENTPHVGGTLLDGAFKTNSVSSQPKILILGAAVSGQSYALFNVSDVGEVEAEFGTESELAKGVHEVVAQGADNIAVMRIGGHLGEVVITETTTLETVTIVPDGRGDEVLSKYHLVVTNEASANRYLLWSNEDEEFVYDTLEEKCINGDLIRLVDTGIDLYTIGDITDPAAAPTLSDLVTGDFTATGGGTIASVAVTEGTDGTSMSLPERYAALNQAYHILDFRDGDIVVPCAVHVDDPNQADGSTAVYDSGVPTAGSAGDVLGKVWQYIYQGKLYTYMIEADAVVTAYATKQFGHSSVGRLTFTALAAGPAGEEVEIKFADTATAGAETISIAGSVVTIGIEDGVSTAAQIKSAYDASAADTTLASVVATVAGAVTIPAAQLGAEVALDLSGALSHEDLTGDSIPAAVVTRWQAATAAEFREVNFAHQLASFCYFASATWKTMIGVIPTLGPDGYDRLSVAEWVGSKPTYTTKGLDLCVDTSGDNGSGILGIKFLAGEAGYRDHMVEDGDAGDGYAYGGFILTEGDSLPNGSDFAYGILESDELLDSNGKPVDIGKYIVITYDRPKHRNSFNGGSTYRGHLAASLAGKIAVTPPNREPIGTAGVIVKISDAPRIHAVQMDELSQMRMTGLRREEGSGHILVDVKTAAHPDSDYTLLSTIRCVNRALQGIRDIGKRFIGKSFSPETIASLDAAVESYMQSEKIRGYNQGFKHTFRYNRNDRILGRLVIKLRMVPPFSLKAIDVEISLAADESEL